MRLSLNLLSVHYGFLFWFSIGLFYSVFLFHKKGCKQGDGSGCQKEQADRSCEEDGGIAVAHNQGSYKILLCHTA